jgi:hypothetical protein
MKDRKHLVLAGVSAADAAEFAAFLRATQFQLDHAWTAAGENDEVDFVLADLADFGGRCARVRALDEGRHFAVLADPGGDVLGAELVLHRPLSAKAVVGMLNHVGRAARPQPRRLIDAGVHRDAAPIVVPPARRATTQAPEPAAGASTRASFLDIRRERPCTNLDALVQRGAVLLERPGLPPLLIDPVADTFHADARMSELEPYFLQVVSGRERRRVGGAQLAALRRHAAARPLVRLRWLNALLRSNGWLASHLDPSASYRLKNWFPLDADYRKQHRIALAMMRGDAPLHRIAAAAKAKMAEVFDVVNAYDALGLVLATRQPVFAISAETRERRRRAASRKPRQAAATGLSAR